MFQTMKRSRAAVAMPVAFGWPGGWRGHPQLILLREQGSDFTQEGLDVVEAFGDLLVGHEAVVRVLVEGTGRVGEVANLGVAGLAAKSADRLQVMAMPAVLSAPLVAAGLEHLDAAPQPFSEARCRPSAASLSLDAWAKRRPLVCGQPK